MKDRIIPLCISHENRVGILLGKERSCLKGDEIDETDRS